MGGWAVERMELVCPAALPAYILSIFSLSLGKAGDPITYWTEESLQRSATCMVPLLNLLLGFPVKRLLRASRL